MFMAYIPQNFKPGDVVTASQLNAMNEQIAINENKINHQYNQVIITKLSGQKIKIIVEGLTPGEEYTLQLMRQPVSTNEISQWQPVREKSYGYAKLAGSETQDINGNIGMYETVPAWMPNNGYIQSVYSFTAQDNIYTKEIDMTTWALPLVKPFLNDEANGIFIDQNPVGFIGISTARPYYMLPFTFYLYDKNNKILLSKSSNIIYINGLIDNEQLTNNKLTMLDEVDELKITKKSFTHLLYVASDELNANTKKLTGLRLIVK